MTDNDRELVTEFLMTLSNAEESSRKQYMSIFTIFSGYIKDKEFTQVTISDVNRYFDERKDKMNRTKNKHITVLKNFFDYLERTKRINVNPVQIKHFNIIEEKGIDKEKILTLDECRALTDVLSNNIKKSTTKFQKVCAVRDKALYLLMLHRGFRVNELLGMEMKEMNVENTTLTVAASKSKNHLPRTIELPLNLWRILEVYLKLRYELVAEDSTIEYIFLSKSGKKMRESNVNSKLKEYGEKAGISADRLHCHTLRHTAGSHHAVNHPIHLTQKMLGHSSITTTQIYFHESAAMIKEISQNSILDEVL